MDKFETEESIEVKNFIKILVILVLIIIGVYFFTRLVITKDLGKTNTTEQTTVEGEIDYSKTIIGAMLTRKEKEYYVLIYDADALEAVTYSGIAYKYSNKENAIKIYYADLGSELNKTYKATNENEVSLSSLSSFKVYDVALVKVVNGNISKTWNTIESIEAELK